MEHAARAAEACHAVSEPLEAAQARSAEELRALGESLKSGFDARSLLEETREYLEEELACVGFLEARVRKNKKEADELASALGAALQRAGQEEKLQQLSVLRRAVANDVEATAALRRFAQEVEALCSAMLTKELVEANKELVTGIYVLFFKLHLKKTLPDELFEIIRAPFQDALPKPAPAPKVVKMEKVVEKEDKKEEAAPVKKGLKWGVVKMPQVKGLDEINKELESSRKWSVCSALHSAWRVEDICLFLSTRFAQRQ